eukprot:316258-Pleurochrysis_carterae.AAC.1
MDAMSTALDSPDLHASQIMCAPCSRMPHTRLHSNTADICRSHLPLPFGFWRVLMTPDVPNAPTT